MLTLGLPGSDAAAQEDPTTPTARPVPLDEGSRPVRVRVPYFDIDLPVVWEGRKVAGNPAGYPLCDVAQYLTSREQELVLPGQPGTAWLYGHAQPGMLLPLTESYFASGRTELMGKLIKLQLRDGRLLTYRISEVDVAFDYDIADRPNERQQRVVLQTSTGTTGASPRLMVAGRLIDAAWTDEPRPEAQATCLLAAAPGTDSEGQGQQEQEREQQREPAGSGDGRAGDRAPRGARRHGAGTRQWRDPSRRHRRSRLHRPPPVAPSPDRQAPDRDEGRAPLRARPSWWMRSGIDRGC